MYVYCIYVHHIKLWNLHLMQASKGYSEVLKWRVKEKIELLRKGIIDLSVEDFIRWVDSVRSPFAPLLVPYLGQTEAKSFAPWPHEFGPRRATWSSLPPRATSRP